ncbi:hypothetical protein B0T24DRAFT_33046 [Lasiosphaeria ovina]|uniref:Uncharacterized protein n=1 Tax=Lasiosphaeria ovina TaxID=92902 RepID=A0AAE0TXE0_9PEZI|nr:hypothetical protein B0T24DRAFT_33046 [Lasiosphaeria ovina]
MGRKRGGTVCNPPAPRVAAPRAGHEGPKQDETQPKSTTTSKGDLRTEDENPSGRLVICSKPPVDRYGFSGPPFPKGSLPKRGQDKTSLYTLLLLFAVSSSPLVALLDMHHEGHHIVPKASKWNFQDDVKIGCYCVQLALNCRVRRSTFGCLAQQPRRRRAVIGARKAVFIPSTCRHPPSSPFSIPGSLLSNPRTYPTTYAAGPWCERT